MNMSEGTYTPPPPPPPPPPPAPPAPTAPAGFDFVRPFAFVFDDPRWLPKILVGGLFYLLGFLLIGFFFIMGYQARLARNVIAGVQNPLPEWDDLGEYFGEGLRLIGVVLVWIIPLAIVVLGGTVEVEAGDARFTSVGERDTSEVGGLQGTAQNLGTALGTRTEEMQALLEGYTGALATALRTAFPQAKIAVCGTFVGSDSQSERRRTWNPRMMKTLRGTNIITTHALMRRASVVRRMRPAAAIVVTGTDQRMKNLPKAGRRGAARSSRPDQVAKVLSIFDGP